MFVLKSLVRPTEVKTYSEMKSLKTFWEDEREISSNRLPFCESVTSSLNDRYYFEKKKKNVFLLDINYKAIFKEYQLQHAFTHTETHT